MLIVRNAQMEAMKLRASDELTERFLPLVGKHWPAEYQQRASESIRATIRHAIAQAVKHGFDTERDILRVVNVQLALGEGFGDDARYPWVRVLLDAKATPSVRANTLVKYTARALGVEL